MVMEIVVVMDRSGSMATCSLDMEGGLNTFVLDQKKLNPDDRFTLVQFDDEYEVVHDGIALESAPPIRLRPRGMTALLDAVGKAITTVASRKPDGVIMLIVTDGAENASKEWKAPALKALVEEKTREGWQFVYLGANVDAFSEAGAMGVSMNSTANYSTKDPASVGAAFVHTSANVMSFRRSSKPVDYTAAQREEILTGEGDRTTTGD